MAKGDQEKGAGTACGGQAAGSSGNDPRIRAARIDDRQIA
jgi:hypothetical protein